MLKLLVVVSIILNSFFMILAPVSAQSSSSGWQINNFQSNINIQPDGKAKVVETINVDFDSLEKHGIFRDIPYIYTDNGNNTYTEIAVSSVKRNGIDENYITSKSNGYIQLKIGNANKTISGNQTYQITYLATGVLRSFEKYDELYWNVTGNNWDVPIQNVNATVNLSSNAIVQTACYQGLYGSTQECESIQNGISANFKSVGPLSPQEGLTAAVGFKKGLVPIITVARPKTLFEKIASPANLLLTLSTFLIIWAVIFRQWWKNGRDFWFRKKTLFDPNAKEERRPLGAHETIVVEYSPPENMRPAELGTVIDQKADTRDIAATIIDLATRGFLKIQEVPKSWLFGKVDYNVIKKDKDASSLLPYEEKLYNSLFSGRQSVNISALKTTFHTKLTSVKDLLYEDVVAKKLFIKRPDKVRTIYLVIAVFVIMGAFAATIFGIASQIAIVVSIGIGIFVGALPLLVLANHMPRRTGNGQNLYLRTKGYYLFIDKAEKYRQRFFENKNLFNEVMPYAITFGLIEKFARTMKDIGLKPQTTGWYVGTHPFNVGTFGNNVESFSNSVSSSMASTPHSSGSSGGGSSGGGFGGGGGGSW